MEIQAVQCPVGESKLEYLFQGSNPYYVKVQVRNGRYVDPALSDAGSCLQP